MMSDIATTTPRDAREAWDHLGWPTPRLEAWRYFPLRSFEFMDPGAAVPAVDLGTRPRGDAFTVVNGRLVPALGPVSDYVSAVTHHETPMALAADGAWADGLEAANAAFGAETITITIPAGQKVVEPIAIAIVTLGDVFVHPRLAITVGAGASATVVVSYRSEGAAFTNVVTSVVLEADARLEHAVVIADDARGCHVEHIDARVGRNASWQAFTATARGGAARTAAHVHLAGEGADAVVDGIYLPRDKSRFDHYVDFDHAARRSSSHATWAGAIDDHATGTFLGRVRIGADVTGCKTRQLTRSLLLAPTATANAKPELHIDCDEVEASHGATIGQLDARQIFYLVSRGIDPKAARDILIHAFIRDAVGRAPAGARATIAAALGLDADAADSVDEVAHDA